VYYSALGHQAKTYDDPAYQQLLEEAMRWLLERSAQSRPAPGG
jgi:type 1 glutamine amidotransferase